MTRRILAALFGAILFTLLAPILLILLSGVPGNLMVVVWVAAAGLIVGAVLGASFPRVFGFIFELFTDI